MKMKNLFKFFCTMALIMMVQSVWAAEYSVVKTQRFKEDGLNQITSTAGGDVFQATTDDELVTVTLASYGHNVKYVYTTEFSMCEGLACAPRRLTVGHVKANDTINGAISFDINAKEGYTAKMASVKTTAMISGGTCYFALGANEQQNVAGEDGKFWTEQSVSNIAGVPSVPFTFIGDASRTCDNGDCSDYYKGAAMRWLEVGYYVIPAKPVWSDGAKDMYVTVSDDQESYFHWYNPYDSIKVLAPEFEENLKLNIEIVSGDPKYMFWNEEHTAFYTLKPMSFKFTAYIDEKPGSYNASEKAVLEVSTKLPAEKPEVFFFVDDAWVRDLDGQGNYTDTFRTSEPLEHFLEYVTVAEGEVVATTKTENVLTYMEIVRERYEHFWMNTTEGNDMLSVVIGEAEGSIRLNAKDADLRHIEFIVDSKEVADAVISDVSNVTRWLSEPYDAHSGQTFNQCIRFDYASSAATKRSFVVSFLGVPDSVFFEYGNAADGQVFRTAEFKTYYSTELTGDNWKAIGDTIYDKRWASIGEQVYCKYAMPIDAKRLRFEYKDAQRGAYIKNLKITERKELTIADTIINFGQQVRTPGADPIVRTDAMRWINLFPEMRYFAEAPFSVESNFDVRLDQYDTVYANNQFQVKMSLDSAGVFSQRMRVASMDVIHPMEAFVWLNGTVIFDTKDMFIQVEGSDTLALDSTAQIVVKDSEGTVLAHDSLIMHLSQPAEGTLIINGNQITPTCVGEHVLYVAVDSNSMVPAYLYDTLYIYTPEPAKDTIIWNIPEVVAVHDSLINLASNRVAGIDLKYKFVPENMVVRNDSVIDVLGVTGKTKVYAYTEESCRYFSVLDSTEIDIKGIVFPELNPAIDWSLVYGGDTIDQILVVKGESGEDLTDLVNIAYEITPADNFSMIGEDGMAILRSGDLDIKATITYDSIKTVVFDSIIKVNNYDVDTIIFPATPKYGAFEYYHVGDSIKVEDFVVIGEKKDGSKKDITKFVDWSFSFDDPKYGHYDEEKEAVVLDSVPEAVLTACVDTQFVNYYCQSKNLLILRCKVDKVIFPDVDMYIVNDTIKIKDLKILDSLGHDISRYVQLSFKFEPDSCCMSDGENIVILKHGLDTVRTIIGGNVVVNDSTSFWERLLVAPEYAANIDFPYSVCTVGDTLRLDAIKVYNRDGEDLTYLSELSFGFADSVAHALANGDIVLDKAGEAININVLVISNQSLAAKRFPETLKVNCIKATGWDYPEGPYMVFGEFNTKAINFYDKNGNNINKYAEWNVDFDATKAAIDENGIITFDKAGDLDISVSLVGNDACSDAPFTATLNVEKYDKAKVQFPEANFRVADVLNVEDIKILDENNNDITSYAQLEYRFDGARARYDADNNIEFTAIDVTTIEVAVIGGDIADMTDSKDYNIDKCIADRLSFPVGDYKVGDSIDINKIVVYNPADKDVTEFADFKFTFAPEADGAHVDGDYIVVDKAPKLIVTIEVGTEATTKMEYNQFVERLPIDQAQAFDVVIDPTTYIVGGTMALSNIAVYAADGRVLTDYAGIALSADNAHNDADGNLVFDAANNNFPVTVTIIGSNVESKSFVKNVTVLPIKADTVVLPAYEFVVGQTLEASAITVWDEDGNNITAYAEVSIDGEPSLLFTESGATYLNIIVGGNNVEAAQFNIPVLVKKISGAVIEFPRGNFRVGDILDVSQIRVKADGVDVTEYAELSYQYQSTQARDAEGNIQFIAVGDVTIKAVATGEVAEIEGEEIYDVNKCVPVQLIFPTLPNFADYVVGDSVNINEIVILDRNGKNITEWADYTFTFRPQDGAHIDGDYIVIDVAGGLRIDIEVGKAIDAKMDYKKFVERLTIDQAVATELVYEKEQFIVGETLTKDMITVYDQRGRELTSYSDLSFGFTEGEAHLDAAGNLVFDKAGDAIGIVINVNGAAGVVEKSFNKDMKVVPCEPYSVELPAYSYVVGASMDTKQIDVFNADGDKITQYAVLTYEFDPEEMHLEGDNIVFDQAGGNIKIVVKVGGNNAVNKDFDKYVVVGEIQNARVQFPTQSFRVGDIVPATSFRVLDANNVDITSYAELSFDFAETEAHMVGNDIMFDKNGQINITVNVAGGRIASFSATEPITVDKCQAAQLIFPVLPDNEDYKVNDRIDIDSIIVKDANGIDITRYADYRFTFEPQRGAHVEDGVIVIDSTCILKIVIEVGTAADAKMEYKSFVTHIGTAPAQATIVDFPVVDPYIVGDTIAISSIRIFDEDMNELTDRATLSFSFIEGQAHLTPNGDIVLDQATQPGAPIVVTVNVAGGNVVAPQALNQVLNVVPCTAAEFIMPAGPYVVGESIDLSEIQVISTLGRDITRYAVLEYAFDTDKAYLSGDSLYFEKSDSQFALTITLVGPNAVGSDIVYLNVEKCVAAAVVFPEVAEYHVSDIINTEDLVVVNANGKDITRYAELSYSFDPQDAAILSAGEIEFVKSGVVTISVIVDGEVQYATFDEVINVVKYQTADIIFQAPDYYEHDTLASVIVIDVNGVDRTEFSTIDYEFSNDTIAHIYNGRIVLDRPGDVTVTMTIYGEGITDTVIVRDLHVRHIEEGICLDLLSLVWDDMMLVDNSSEDLPKFVDYVWFRDEYVIANQSTQNYYVRPEDKDGRPHIFYVRAYDIDGNEYLICEKEYTFGETAARRSFQVYPTLMSAADNYTVETSEDGQVFIFNSNGNAMGNFQVEAGANNASAPYVPGVYILRYESVNGQSAIRKLIVK